MCPPVWRRSRVAMLAAGGCELLVPDSLPAFTCRPAPTRARRHDLRCGHRPLRTSRQVCGPEGCPSGTPVQQSSAMGLRIARRGLGNPSHDGSPRRSTRSDAHRGCKPTPAAARDDAVSSARLQVQRRTRIVRVGICADQVTVTSDVYDAAGKAGLLHEACCTLTDDASTVLLCDGRRRRLLRASGVASVDSIVPDRRSAGHGRASLDEEVSVRGSVPKRHLRRHVLLGP